MHVGVIYCVLLKFLHKLTGIGNPLSAPWHELRASRHSRHRMPTTFIVRSEPVRGTGQSMCGHKRVEAIVWLSNSQYRGSAAGTKHQKAEGQSRQLQMLHFSRTDSRQDKMIHYRHIPTYNN